MIILSVIFILGLAIVLGFVGFAHMLEVAFNLINGKVSDARMEHPVKRFQLGILFVFCSVVSCVVYLRVISDLAS